MTHFANMNSVPAGDRDIKVINDLNKDKVDDFVNKHESWHDKPELEQWLNQQEEKHKDPLYEHVDGLFPSDPIHKEPVVDPNLHPIFGNHRRTPEYMENAKRFNGDKEDATVLRKPEAVSGKQPNPNHLQEALKNMGDMGIELPEGLRDLLEKK